MTQSQNLNLALSLCCIAVISYTTSLSMFASLIMIHLDKVKDGKISAFVFGEEIQYSLYLLFSFIPPKTELRLSPAFFVTQRVFFFIISSLILLFVMDNSISTIGGYLYIVHVILLLLYVYLIYRLFTRLSRI